MLEQLIQQAENYIGGFVQQIPWYGNLVFHSEIRQLNQATVQLQNVRASKKNTVDWYKLHTNAVHDYYDAAQTFVHSAYKLYDGVKGIPFIGSYLENTLQATMRSALSKLPSVPGMQKPTIASIPSYKRTNTLLNAARTYRLEVLALDAHETTGRSLDTTRKFVLERQPRIESKGYWLQEAATNVLQAAGEFLSDLFGESTPAYN